MILLTLIISAGGYQASTQQAAKESPLPMIPHCDSTRKLGEPDYVDAEVNPTLPSDTLSRVPPLKTKLRSFAASENEVYEYYTGKRGKEVKHGLYQRVPKDIPQGRVIEEGYYSHNIRIGKWITRYPTGNVRTESEYRKGKLNGKLIVHHENGLIFEQQELVDGRSNCKEEYSFGYHNNGKLHFETRVRDGYVIQDSRYDTSGLPIVKDVPPD